MSTNDKDLHFMKEHIFKRVLIDEYLKEDTIQKQANRAFYSTWTNFIFNNPKTENLRELKESDYAIIKKLTFGAKNRLQSYLAYHLNKDHYDLLFTRLSDEAAIASIEMCLEIYNDTKILVDWWRNPIDETNQTGEEWFQKCKEKHQHQKNVNRVGFLFINLVAKTFLKVENNKFYWTKKQSDATLFNVVDKDGIILDQNEKETQTILLTNLQKEMSLKNLKMFFGNRTAQNTFFTYEK